MQLVERPTANEAALRGVTMTDVQQNCLMMGEHLHQQMAEVLDLRAKVASLEKSELKHQGRQNSDLCTGGRRYGAAYRAR